MPEIVPFAHQARGVRIAAENPRFGFFWKPGLGKTFLMLFVQKQRPMVTLVLCPKSIMRSAWQQDATAIGLESVVCWHATKAKRLELIHAPGDHILITNAETFVNNMDDFRKRGIQRIVLDESSMYKNRNSKRTKAVLVFADTCEEVYLLSGTPSPNCPTELWSQLRAISFKATAGSFFQWAHRFMSPTTRKIRQKVKLRDGCVVMQEKNVITGWLFKDPLSKQRFTESIRPWTWYLTKEECLDLPDRTDQIRHITLSTDERRMYNEILQDKLIDLDDGIDPEPVKIEAVGMKLRQVTGGNIIVETGTPAIHVGKSKLDELSTVLDEIGDEPCVIWAEFRAEIDRIYDLCKERGDSVEWIDGRNSGRAHETVSAFQAGKIQRLICHPQACGHGITLTAAAYAIFFSLSFSSERHEQARDRIHRAGQTRSCTYIYLVAENTIDAGVLETVQQKTTKQEAILNELKRKSRRRR